MQWWCAMLSLWHTTLYNIFPHYLIHCTIFEKKTKNYWTQNVCFDFLFKFVWNIWHSKKKWATYDRKCVYWGSCTVTFLLVQFSLQICLKQLTLQEEMSDVWSKMCILGFMYSNLSSCPIFSTNLSETIDTPRRNERRMIENVYIGVHVQ